MPYVERDALARIVGLYHVEQYPGQEHVQAAELYTDHRTAVLADFVARREVYLNRLTGIAGRAARSANVLISDAADAFAQGLLDLPAYPAVAEAMADCKTAQTPEAAEALRRSIFARYAALRDVARATPGAKGEFDKVDKA